MAHATYLDKVGRVNDWLATFFFENDLPFTLELGDKYHDVQQGTTCDQVDGNVLDHLSQYVWNHTVTEDTHMILPRIL